MFNSGMLLSTGTTTPASTDYFKTYSRTGTGAAANITDAGFQPNLIITVPFASAAPQVPTMDSVMGTGKYNNLAITSLQTDAQSLTGFLSTGYSLGTAAAVNTNAAVYQDMVWRGGNGLFDIVGFTGNATNRSINHNLGITPQFMMITNANGFILIYHVGLDATAPQNYGNYWSNGDVQPRLLSAAVWNNTAPTSTQFTVGTGGTNNNGEAMTMRLWGAVAGKSAFGTYVGNGSATGPTVSGLGFTPTLVFIMRRLPTTGTNYYATYGNTKNSSINKQSTGGGTSNLLDLVSDGFNVKTTFVDYNENGLTYMYAAWA